MFKHWQDTSFANMYKTVFACFIDFEKAFDKVQHCKLILILYQLDIDDRNVGFILKLYPEQNVMRVKIKTYKKFNLKRGVYYSFSYSKYTQNIRLEKHNLMSTR